MPKIHLETFVAAPVELCFDLNLNVQLHEAAGHGRAVAGVTQGQLRLGDTVTWEAVHFGVRQRLTSKIVACERPHMFVDEMQRGAFARWRHTHLFKTLDGGTSVVDEVDYASPLGLLGKIADALFLKNYMTRFLIRHNAHFKRMAEAKALEASSLNKHSQDGIVSNTFAAKR
jgi:ligand-binding SRPBCC domain-containing protein